MSNDITDMATRDLWNRARTIFMASFHAEDERSQAERYFSMITSVVSDGPDIVIAANSSFASDLLKEKYAGSLKNCFVLAGGNKEMELRFTVDEKSVPSIVSVAAPQPSREQPSQTVQSYSQYSSSTPNFTSTTPLNPAYTFDEFVEGLSNSWAYHAARGVVEHPGAKGYNPLFIHGGTGLGKTHLMQAIGNELRRKNPRISVCYITAETFLNEYINALQNGGLNAFRDIYRKIDVLLVDDVQFLQRGKQCQEEFFNTFNALTDAQKQIVMTSDVAPKNLPAIEERLISRFEGGMVQEIEKPNYEMRLAILKKKAEGMSPSIPDVAIRFIADNIKSHVRAMEGALARVRLAVSVSPTSILTNEMLSHQLKDFVEKEQTMRKVTIDEIQKVVAAKYSVTVKDILSPERTQSIVTPRQLAMYISRKYTMRSLQEIADKFEKKHATILHGVKTISKRLDVEEDLRQTLEQIVQEFGLKPTDKVD